MNWERLREKVLQEIYPSTEDREGIQGKYSEISEFIEQNYSVETHFAGSASRGTGMKGDNDIDLFVLFPESLGKEKLENKGLEIGKKTFQHFNGEYEIEYAEHPYTKGDIDGYEVEIVPCYDTSPEDIKSSVDRTPHHSRWVENSLTKEQRKDVVLLKKFLDVEGIYGSSLKTRGFSGYLCEILIAEYGSFQKLVEEAVKWDRKQLIDIEEHYSGDLPSHLEKKFEDEPLVVLDPVDSERNVASVLTDENYSRFIYLCWRFSRDPGLRFFKEEEQKYTEFEIRQEIEKRGDFLVLEFENPEAVEDVVHPQLRKSLRRLEKEFEKHGFRVFESGYHVGSETRIFFEMEMQLPEVEEVEGPSVFHGEEHIEQFTSKYSNVFVREDRLCAKTDREYTDAKDLLKEFLSGNLEEKGIPNYVSDKAEEFSFTEPVVNDEKWLNYLGKKLHVRKE